MKFFIDTAEFEEIKAAYKLGFVDGVTTNPSLIVKSKRNLQEVIKEIAALVEGPVSAEVIATEAPDMVKEAHELVKLGDNVVIKVPMTPEGLKAVAILSKEGIKTNVTLIFSANQALLAARAGATYVSPFVGRIDDISMDGITLIEMSLKFSWFIISKQKLSQLAYVHQFTLHNVQRLVRTSLLYHIKYYYKL